MPRLALGSYAMLHAMVPYLEVTPMAFLHQWGLGLALVVACQGVLYPPEAIGLCPPHRE